MIRRNPKRILTDEEFAAYKVIFNGKLKQMRKDRKNTFFRASKKLDMLKELTGHSSYKLSNDYKKSGAKYNAIMYEKWLDRRLKNEYDIGLD